MIYVNMALGSGHGWGVCGKHIALELSRLEPVRVISEPVHISAIGSALEFHCLQELLLDGDEERAFSKVDGSLVADGPILQGIGGERLLPRRTDIRGTRTIGYTFFERNILRPEWIENGRRCFDRIATGSSWCTQTLTDAGVDDVATVIQGVDTRLFRPIAEEPGKEFLEDRFVVFSGGKFEFRKAQDVVIRAYKVLQDRHADVMLVNAWFNPWPAALETMRASSLIRFAPRGRSYEEVVGRILADNGLDLRRVITCGQQLDLAMPRIYRNTDVGLFPNRCEGGTNLVLMEYMACGKPVVAVNTTGHADIVNAANALVLRAKGETTIHDENNLPVARWPEPDLDDAIDKLEWAYQNRDKMRALGQQAAKELAERTWRRTAEAFQRIIHETGR